MTNLSTELPPSSSNFKWYMLTARSKFENKAKVAILASIRSAGKESLFGQIIVPEVAQTVVVNGVKKTKMHTLYPNYMLIQMVASDETVLLVKNSTHVTGFIGDSNNLQPLSDSEVEKILSQMTNTANLIPSSKSFKSGDSVRVTDGPFNGFTGIVNELKSDKMKVVVLVSIFGRETKVELDYNQVSKS